MSDEVLRVAVDGGVAMVTINRPKVLNALNEALFAALQRAFTELALNDVVRVILVTGAGEKAFVAGADIGELRALEGSEAGEAAARRGQAVFRLIETCGKPVIALINGFALGGGCELALACTMRLASETAKLGLPEAKLGLIPGYGGTQRLPRLVGRSAALKMMLTGEMIDAAEALRLGLVEEVVPPGRLLERGRELAEKIASGAPLAVQASMEAVARGAEMTLLEATAVEAAIFGKLCGTDDVREGTEAFLQKRKATWSGR